MLKKLHVLLLILLAAVCFTATAWADYDYIEQYGVMVTPNTEDGSLLITVKLEWTPLEELPYGQELKIGVPNGSIRDVAAQTDNIERLDFDNSYMYVYLDRAYEANETFSFAYSWVQEYMYQLSTNGVIEDYDNVHYDYVTYDYTAGWFDEARIGQMTLIWNDPAGLTGDFTEGTVSGADSVTVQDGMTITASDLDYGYKMNIQVRYTDWPTQLSEEYSADNLPSDYDHCVYVPCEHFEDDTGDAIVGMMVMIFVVIFIIVLISAARRGDGYAGGFGTRYVFVNHLWYPAGPDGRPRPGSVGTKTKPRPPRSGGGFGGHGQGGERRGQRSVVETGHRCSFSVIQNYHKPTAKAPEIVPKNANRVQKPFDFVESDLKFVLKPRRRPLRAPSFDKSGIGLHKTETPLQKFRKGLVIINKRSPRFVVPL